MISKNKVRCNFVLNRSSRELAEQISSDYGISLSMFFACCVEMFLCSGINFTHFKNDFNEFVKFYDLRSN